jgi:hypothetical protein
MTPTFAASRLKLVATIVAASGVLLAAAAIPGVSAPGALFVDLAFWPFDGRQTVAAPEARLLIGIGGGLTVGLCVMAWMVADRVMPRDPEAARAIVAVGIGSWFIVDSVASVAAGAPANALFNVPILLAFLWPMRGLKAQPA